MQINSTTKPQHTNTVSCPMLDLIEAAHAIVCTFTVDNETQNQALSHSAVVKMLRGVDDLIGRANNSVAWVTNNSKEVEEWSGTHDHLPESWMFQAKRATTVDIDLLGTACVRMQGLIRVCVALGETDSEFTSLKGNDYINAMWALEGMLAQAVAIVRVAQPAPSLEAVAA